MTSEHWVVVGAGSAGCVVAARLSADGRRRVTLLDDGPDLVDGHVPRSIDGPNFFDALAEPGRTHRGLLASRFTGAPRTPYPRGRGVGGSSAVNAMIALRGDPTRYAAWGWDDADEMWDRVAIPVEPPDPDELGVVDRALLAADPAAVPAPLTRRSGRRVTSAEAYLWPALGRTGPEVRPDTAVSEIVFEGRRAVGVRLVGGTEIAADRVVLTAGALHSPALLLRSGVDTPGVGVGLQDHPSAPLSLELADHADPQGLVVGALAHHDGIQLLPMNHLGSDAQGFGLLMVALMTPRSRAGTVTLGADSEPIIDFALLDDDRDVAELVRGVRIALDLLRTPAFTAIAHQVYLDAHGTTAGALRTDEEIAAWVTSNAGDYVHASSTCAQGTVVDGDGAVIGYDRLYVCDASIFPTIPDANTHLPTTMLAERLCARWLAADRR